MILILSNKYDLSVDYVVRLLSKKGKKFLRINTESLLNSKVSVSFPRFNYKIERRCSCFDLADKFKSVWFRRPGKPFEFDDQEKLPGPSVVAFVENQWHAFIEGLKSISNLFWVNNPDDNHTTENKILQLNMAQRIGLRIPKTCITNDKGEALQFLKDCDGEIVAKALYLPLIEEDKADYFIFANVVDTIENVPEHEFRLAPTIFQEHLRDKKDYRLTIIGDRCFSVEVVRESVKGTITDWRIIKEGIRFRPCELPSDVVAKCVELVKAFGLTFGAIDLVQTLDDYYFLEINPNGEWAWLQKEAKLPIAESLVNVLTQGGLEA